LNVLFIPEPLRLSFIVCVTGALGRTEGDPLGVELIIVYPNTPELIFEAAGYFTDPLSLT
jgi:hypothetical protein